MDIPIFLFLIKLRIYSNYLACDIKYMFNIHQHKNCIVGQNLLDI